MTDEDIARATDMVRATPIPSRTVSLADMTAGELAAIFAHMPSDEQAHFFNAVASEVRGWPGLGRCGQCAYIIDGLSDEGAKVILTLAGHVQAKVYA